MTIAHSTKLDAPSNNVKIAVRTYLAGLITIYLLLLWQHSTAIINALSEFWIFAPVGVIGAIIANATGTGGGVVFIPAFESLSMLDMPGAMGIKGEEKIGISFFIQCFGMSVGSAIWILRFFGAPSKKTDSSSIDAGNFITMVFTATITTIPSLLVAQFFLFESIDKDLIITAFKWFSLALGVFLLIFTWAYKGVRASRTVPERIDIYALILIGAIGGVITAFFSVGVGELIAVYLLWRKFPVPVAISIAVVVSVVTVIAGVWFHIDQGNIVWPIALIAVPGAMIGGFIARVFVMALGPLWLKTFAALWIIISSLVLLAK